MVEMSPFLLEEPSPLPGRPLEADRARRVGRGMGGRSQGDTRRGRDHHPRPTHSSPLQGLPGPAPLVWGSLVPGARWLGVLVVPRYYPPGILTQLGTQDP